MIYNKILTFKRFRKKVLYIFLFVIFIVALIFRLLFLGTNLPGLYVDELNLFLSAYAQLYHIGNLTVPGYNFKDFIFYTINGYIPSILLFHTTPFAARFPNALYGSLSVFPIYLISKLFFKKKEIGLIAALIWAISPSAIMTSRVGYGVEIFPLFLFLFFVFFWIKSIYTPKFNYIFISGLLFLSFFVLPSVGVWDIIPSLAIIIFTIIPILITKLKVLKYRIILPFQYLIAFFISLIIIWVVLLFGPSVLERIGITYNLSGIGLNELLVSPPFPGSLLNFFTRMIYFLAPWKMFWLAEFSRKGLNYSSPVFVPSLLSFTIPFFYAGVFIFPIIFRKQNENLHVYSILIALMLFGLVTPVLNISGGGPILERNLEPSEAIFSLPFYAVITSFFIYLFFTRCLNYIKNRKENYEHKNHPKKLKTLIYPTLKFLVTILMITVIVFAGINVINFSNDLYISSNAYYEDNGASLNYMFYGWEHVSNFLTKTGLYKEKLYYTPGREGNYNLTNTCNFNYWFYHENFPLYWLYTYSGRKIDNISPLYPDELPPVPYNHSIILSQNSNYPKLLLANGFTYTILYTVYKDNGQIAVQVIQVRDFINSTEIVNVNKSQIFNSNNIEHESTYSDVKLENLSSMSVLINFSFKKSSLQNGSKYTLINSSTPTFGFNIWPKDIFIHNTSNSNFVAAGYIYSNFNGNYSAVPHTWYRMYVPISLQPNINYTLAMTFNHGLMILYLNGYIIGGYRLNYGLYPTTSKLTLDSNINANIHYVKIFNSSLNDGEIGYFTYHNNI